MTLSSARRAGGAGVALLALGLLSLMGYGWLAFGFRATNRPRDVTLFLAILGALFLLLPWALRAARRLARGRPRAAVGVVLLFAALFRLALLGAGLPPERPLAALADDLSGRGPGYDAFLLYDNDLWRYLWDGHVTASGLDPYARSPAELGDLAFDDEAGEAAGLLAGPVWEEVWDRLSYRTYASVYPPAAQLLFALPHGLVPGSAFVLKLLVAAADLGSCWLLVLLLRLLGRRPEEALLYAWNPLAVKELAGSGHVDAVMIFLFLAALLAVLHGRDRGAGALFAGATLVKLAPLPVVGVLISPRRWRRWWLGAAVAVVLCLPFLRGLPGMARALGTYGREWVFNAGFWNLAASAARWLGAERPEAVAHGASRLLIGAMVLLVTLAVWRASPIDSSPASQAQRRVDASFLILAALVLLGPAVMPWYLLWAAPLAVAAGFAAWTLLTALSLLSYLVYLFRAEHAAWLWIEHGGFLLVAIWELKRKPELARRLGALLRPRLAGT